MQWQDMNIHITVVLREFTSPLLVDWFLAFENSNMHLCHLFSTGFSPFLELPLLVSSVNEMVNDLCRKRYAWDSNTLYFISSTVEHEGLTLQHQLSSNAWT